MITKNKQRKN